MVTLLSESDAKRWAARHSCNNRRRTASRQRCSSLARHTLAGVKAELLAERDIEVTVEVN